MGVKPSMHSVNWPASLEFSLPLKSPLTHPRMAIYRAAHSPTSTQLQVPVRIEQRHGQTQPQLSPASPLSLGHFPD